MHMVADVRHMILPASCHPSTLALYQYWLARCGSRPMPARSDIDPVEFPRGTLPGISLVDIVPDDRRYVYRLVGTAEVEVRGQDPTGKSVMEGFFGPSVEDALRCYDQVVATGAPLLDPVPFTTPDGRYVTEETIFLPLSDDGTHVNKVIVYSHSRASDGPLP